MNTVNLPYPSIAAAQPNPEYAKMMLSNVGGENSEMSAVSLYLYDALVTQERPEIAQVFHRISLVEMRHLEIFSKLALQLGADPRLWEQRGRRKKYWTPAYNKYSPKLRKILTNALFGEHMALEKYREQAKLIKDENVVENLNRIILDEKSHIEAFTELIKQL